MQKILSPVLVFFMLISFCSTSNAQTAQTIKHGKYTLHISGNDDKFSPQLTQRLIDVFFIVYPEIGERIQ
ncbi:MAG: hypothetical protein WDM90_10745 [Ferruginibacter sp.]